MAGTEQPTNVGAFENAPGAVTVTWDHSGIGAFGFVLEQVSPPAVRALDADKRLFTVAGLEPSTTYEYRVCAVFDTNRVCSDENGGRLVSVTTMPPEQPGAPPVTPPSGLRISAYHDGVATLEWENGEAYDKVLVRWGLQSSAATQVDLDGSPTTARLDHITPNADFVIGVKGGQEGLLGVAYSSWAGLEWHSSLDTASLRTMLEFRGLPVDGGVRAHTGGETSLHRWMTGA